MKAKLESFCPRKNQTWDSVFESKVSSFESGVAALLKLVLSAFDVLVLGSGCPTLSCWYVGRVFMVLPTASYHA